MHCSKVPTCRCHSPFCEIYIELCRGERFLYNDLAILGVHQCDAGAKLPDVNLIDDVGDHLAPCNSRLRYEDQVDFWPHDLVVCYVAQLVVDVLSCKEFFEFANIDFLRHIFSLFSHWFNHEYLLLSYLKFFSLLGL